MLVAESRMVMGKAHVFHVGSLSKYENGSIQPTRTLKRLAKFFSVSTDFILGVDTADFPTVLLDKSVENHVKKYLLLSEDSRIVVDRMVDLLYKKEENRHKK